MPHVGQEMLTISGTPDFTPFGEFMILLIRYTYTLCITELVSLRTICLLINDSSLFAWISLTALSRDLFYKVGIGVNISLNHSNNLWEVVLDHYLL